MSGYNLRQTLVKNAASASWDDQASALVFEDRAYGYAELVAAVDSICVGLQEEGFRAGDRLMALLPNGVEYVELFFAVASLGGALVPANYLLSAPEVRHMWDDSGSTWFVVHERYLDRACQVLESGPAAERTFLVGGPGDYRSYEDLRREGAAFEPPEVGTDEVALLQYTSGTSGLPKAALHTHATLMWNMAQQVTDFRLSRDDAYVCVPALCWAAGFHDFLLPLFWVGGKVVLLPSQNFDPEELAELLARHGGSIVILVPSVLRRVVASGALTRHDLNRLRLVLAGGEALPVELIEGFQEALPGVWLTQAYGMSEGPMIMTFLAESDAISRRGSAGKAMMATQIRVVDEQARPVDPGTVGEIVVRSPATMIGYHNATEKNAEVFRDGWFHTGDGGYLDEDGYLYVAGRLKDMFITGGLNVYPAEIERVLHTHPAVVEAAVVGVPDERLSEVGQAFLVLREGQTLSAEEIRDYTAERLATFKVPRYWEFLSPSLPKTASGKIKKSELREAAAGLEKRT